MAVADVDILLQGLSVSQCCLYPAVAQEALHLLQGHPALEGQGCGCMPENVRCYMAGDIAAGENLLDLILHGLHLQPVMRSPTADEKRGAVIVPGGQVGPEGDLRFSVHEGGTALTALAAFDVDGMILPVNIIEVESTEFGHAAGGGEQEVHHRLFPECLTNTADRLQLQGRHREPFRAVHTYRRNAADGVLLDEVFLRAPLKEAVQA